MKFLVLKEVVVGDGCVVVIFEIVKKYVGFGYEVILEVGVGVSVGYIDEVYIEVGVKIVKIVVSVVKGVDVLFCVCMLDVGKLLDGLIIIGLFDLFKFDVSVFNDKKVIMLVMEFILCIICVQSMDVLFL